MSDKKLVLDPSKINGQAPKSPEKFCHRSIKVDMVPQDVQQLNPLTQKIERGVRLDVRPFNMTCAKALCSLWNEEAGECFDVTAARSQARTAQKLDEIDGLLRIGNPLQAGS